jgi:hypothetical protein
MVITEIEFGQLAAGQISGQVQSDNGEAVPRPAVVVSQNGRPIFWAIGDKGRYEMQLPVGDYEVYATARGHGQSQSKSVAVTKDSASVIDFNDVRAPGDLLFQVVDENGLPLDARISIREGQKPLIGFFGRDVFFTELHEHGQTRESVAPGSYVFEFSAGGGFTSEPQQSEVVVVSQESQTVRVTIPVVATPHEAGWYNADLHHHSDVLDGFTEAEYVMRSELAAGVNIAFLSDHDSVINNDEMLSLSGARAMPFIPGTELSPSFGHFNAYPVDDEESVAIDTGKASVQEIFAEARRMGAEVIAVNHPYSESGGYFESLEKDAAPGGFDDGFDLIEIVIPEYNERSRRTVQRAWALWSEGQRKYLTAGSDAHDVWTDVSGAARTYVHVDGDLTIDKFVAGLRAGHSYASQGPLVFPEILFGTDISRAAGASLDLRYKVQAVSGLKSVKLIERGNVIGDQEMVGEADPLQVDFAVNPVEDTWYSLVVEDINGKFAYTNPVWVSLTN